MVLLGDWFGGERLVSQVWRSSVLVVTLGVVREVGFWGEGVVRVEVMDFWGDAGCGLRGWWGGHDFGVRFGRDGV